MRHWSTGGKKSADEPIGDELCELWMASACINALGEDIGDCVRAGGRASMPCSPENILMVEPPSMILDGCGRETSRRVMDICL